MLQQGSNQVVPYCGLEHADIKGQHLFNKTNEYDDVEEIENPCSNCTRNLRLNKEDKFNGA